MCVALCFSVEDSLPYSQSHPYNLALVYFCTHLLSLFPVNTVLYNVALGDGGRRAKVQPGWLHYGSVLPSEPSLIYKTSS